MAILCNHRDNNVRPLDRFQLKKRQVSRNEMLLEKQMKCFQLKIYSKCRALLLIHEIDFRNEDIEV